MKFLVIAPSRYLNLIASAISCRPHSVRVHRWTAAVSGGRRCSYVVSTFVQGVNDVNQQQPVDVLLPKLCQWLECSRTEAEKICARFVKLNYVHVNSVKEYIHFLNVNGIDSSVLLEHPWLLHFPPDEMKVRIDILRRIGHEVEPYTIPLLRLPTRYLASVVNQWLLEEEMFSKCDKFVNRLHYFADNLQCTRYHVATLMNRHYFLLTMDFDRITRIMQVLLENCIPSEEIKNDLWIFFYNERLIHERIETARKSGVDPIKIWMLRCPENKFTKKMEKWKKTKDVLGIHKDQSGYLAERLQCSEEDVVELARKYNKLPSIGIPKVKLILDFLFENGFTTKEVRGAPRILGHSIKTVATRLQELERLGYRPNRLRLLFTTAKQYKLLIDRIHQAKNM